MGICGIALGFWCRGHYHLVAKPAPPVASNEGVKDGAAIFFREGCYGCHAVSEWPKLAPPAPSLAFVKSKLTREWIYTWLVTPDRYRRDLRASSHFLRHELALPLGVQARALTSYLLAVSRPFSKSGFAHQPGGESLYKKIGCEACHGKAEESFTNLGVKTNAAWLAAFLRQPQNYSPGTPMPNFHLSLSDANALGSFLGEQGDGIFEVHFPHLDRETVDAVDAALTGFGISTVHDTALEAALFADKEVALGEHLYALDGCAGCHENRASTAPPREALDPDALPAMRRPGGPHLQFALSAEEEVDVEQFVRAPKGAPPTAAEAGAFEARALGCFACHGHGEVPALNGEGDRVTPEWLFAYLAKPYKLRPMLPVEMPAFALSEAELNALVAALGDLRFSVAPEPGEATKLATCRDCHDGKKQEALSALRRFRPSYLSEFLTHHPKDETPEQSEALVRALWNH